MRCYGYLRNECTNRAKEDIDQHWWCDECWNKYVELNKKIAAKKEDSSDIIQGESKMVIYECFYQQHDKTSEQCQQCYQKEMKEKYKTRAACVQDNAEKKDGDSF